MGNFSLKRSRRTFASSVQYLPKDLLQNHEALLGFHLVMCSVDKQLKVTEEIQDQLVPLCCGVTLKNWECPSLHDMRKSMRIKLLPMKLTGNPMFIP